MVPRKYISVRVLSLNHHIIKESFLKCKRKLKRLVNGPIVWLSVCPSVCMSVCLSVCVSGCSAFYSIICFSFPLSVYPPISVRCSPCMSVLSCSLSVSLSVFLSICLFLSALVYHLSVGSSFPLSVFHLLIHQAEYCNKKVLWSVLIIILQTSHHTSRFRHQPPKKTWRSQWKRLLLCSTTHVWGGHCGP